MHSMVCRGHGLVSAAKRRLANAVVPGDSDTARARNNALLAFGIRVLSAAILFASQVLLARWMGGHDYGVYIYAWTWMLILGALATFGFNFSAIRLVAEFIERQKLDELRGFLLGGRLMVLGSGAVIAALGIVVHSMLSGSVTMSGLLAGGGAAALAIMLLAVPASALSDIQDGIGRGSACLLSGLLGPYVLRPLLVLAGVAGLYWAGVPLSATTAACAAVAAVWTAWAIQTLMVERQVAQRVPKGARSYNFRSWFATSLPLMVISGSDLALQTTDVIVISNMLTPTDAGIYFAAAKTMGLILFVHYAVGSSMANRFAAISARGAADQMQAVAREAVSWTFWPSLVLGIAMLAAGWPLLALFGDEFTAGYPVMCVLVAGFLMRAAVGPIDFLLNMTGGQVACARTLAGVAVVNVVLNLLLVPVAGIMGAAVAVSASLMLGAIINYRIARRRLGFSFAIWSRQG